MWKNYAIAILGLAILMIVHECGHFFVARAFGMRVIKFSIGFGPTFFKIRPDDGYYWFTTAADRIKLRLWRHDPERHGPTIYQVAMIPFLAYVQIAGMNPLEEIEENDPGSYANASLIARISTIFAGPLANYLFASVFFFAHFVVGGQEVPRQDERGSTEVSVMAASPAEAAGIKNGDQIVEVNQKPVETWMEMADVISKNPERAIPVVVLRSGERITLTVTPKRIDVGKKKIVKGRIGVQRRIHHVDLTAKEAALLAVKQPPVVVRDFAVSISQWASGETEGELSGPVGMVREAAKIVRSSFVDFIALLGALSAYLGAFNLIPFPALDGGRLMFLGYEATTRRRPNAKIETQIHLVGLLMMLGLMGYVTLFNDLRRSDGNDGPPEAPPTSSASTPPPKAPDPAATPPPLPSTTTTPAAPSDK
jgi:regulator of sigma E protease